jgi:hypothetical protein
VGRQKTVRGSVGGWRVALALAGVALSFALSAAFVPADPPGFTIDESSVAYNAHLIAQTGRDEYGEAWPLYFRAFGDYKNPTYIYLLAALFRLTGPGILPARALSAALGALAALGLGLLAARMTRRAGVGAVVALSALLTPWLYESSRLVFEVAVYPLAVVLFLLALWRASAKEQWRLSDVLALASTLALLTYSYSVGRLLAPMLAAGLAFFVARGRWRGVALTWLAYAAALVPLLVFDWRHPGALTGRFGLLTYVTPQSTFGDDAREFVRHYAADVNPWRWLATGEANVRDHVSGAGALLAVTVLLAFAGLVLVLRRHRREAWWRFVLYALAVSVVPAALTRNEFPQLRLVAFPVLLHVFTVPALAWLSEGRVVRRFRFGGRAGLSSVVVLALLQGACFQWLFHAGAAERWYVFDARFPRKVLAVALATGRRPVYLYDPPGRSGYIQAYWYGVLGGLDASQFVRLPDGEAPPPGALLVSTEEDCTNCRLLAKSINYIVYAVPPSDVTLKVAPLPPEAFRADISAREVPSTLKMGRSETLEVIVRNRGAATWPAVGEADGRYGVTLRDRWLKADGTTLTDEDGRTRILYDLEPGDAAGMALRITAPASPGEYVLELDVVQESVAWFGEQGSQTLRARVRVEPSR